VSTRGQYENRIEEERDGKEEVKVGTGENDSEGRAKSIHRRTSAADNSRSLCHAKPRGPMIKASVELIDPTLPEGFISVGKSSHVVHSQPTILGETVSVTVTVTEKEGIASCLK
jgi:hypothetical protein